MLQQLRLGSVTSICSTSNVSNKRLLGLTLATSLAIAASLSLARRLIKDWRQRRRTRSALAAKAASRKRAKAEFGSYLAQQVMSDAEESAIASLSARQLVEQLRSGQLRPDRVLLAFYRRAFRADQRLNCVAEFLRPNMAEINLKGPLAGLPVSVKENFSIKGLDSCIGCAAFIGQPADEDCLPVKQLKALGGVPFVRTIVPQTMLSYLSTNPIDGTVLNPASPDRCPGGSSSGEGALIGAGGSPLGIGSDIGGSIRTPSAWCGIAGLKPTGGRISRRGVREAANQRLVAPSAGPMAPDVDSLTLLLEAFASLSKSSSSVPTGLADAALPPLNFDADEASSEKPMTIGYFVRHHGGAEQPAPCMERAVLLARDRLSARGHRLVPWSPPPPPGGVSTALLETYVRCVWSDGGSHMRGLLRHDIASVSVANFAGIIALPVRLRRCLASLLWLLGDGEKALILDCLSGVHSVQEMWYMAQELQLYEASFLAAWQEAGLDALLCPANATPAPPIDDASVTRHSLPHNLLANLLQLPAGVVPVGKVTIDDLEALEAGEGLPAELVALQAGSLGLPIAVQCVALPWRDDTCLRLMSEVEVAVKE